MAEQRPEERRRSAEEAEEREEGPARPLRLSREWRADAEAFRRVVQPEPDDQHDRQTDLVPGRRLSDREPFREVVQSDPRREEADAPARHGGAASTEGAHPTGIERREQQGRDDLQRIERPAGVDWQVG